MNKVDFERKAVALLIPTSSQHAAPSLCVDFTRYYFDSCEELARKWPKHEARFREIGMKVEYLETAEDLAKNICRWDARRNVILVAFFDEHGNIMPRSTL